MDILSLRKIFSCLLTVLALGSSLVQASTLNVPFTFPNGQPVSPAGVNSNFSFVEIAVNDNHIRIAQLEAQIDALQDYINQLQAVMQLQTDAQGHPAVVFSGVNVHVNNGLGATASTNGRGNLIVGYDEPRTNVQVLSCSKGEFDNQADCEANDGLWALSYKTGSHNLIVGPGHNYSRNGGFVAGFENIINHFNASVLGGANNMASGASSTVSGGANNVVAGAFGSVSGGNNNRASGLFSAVSGGAGNIASGETSSVSGGDGNAAVGLRSSISGGRNNTARGANSSVSGGDTNSAFGNYSSISGGDTNNAFGSYSSISGGANNATRGVNSSVSGGNSRSVLGTSDWRAGGLFQDQ